MNDPNPDAILDVVYDALSVEQRRAFADWLNRYEKLLIAAAAGSKKSLDAAYAQLRAVDDYHRKFRRGE